MENQIECIQNYNSIHVPFLDKIPYNPTLISRECFEVVLHGSSVTSSSPAQWVSSLRQK